MLFVNKFGLHLKYYNIMHDEPDLDFKSVCLFDVDLAIACLFICNKYNKI